VIQPLILQHSAQGAGRRKDTNIPEQKCVKVSGIIIFDTFCIGERRAGVERFEKDID